MEDLIEDVTPIRPRTDEEERESLRRLAAQPPELLLVASDLHLGAGRDPATGSFPSNANFLAAETFARWLDHYRADAGRAALVLNGDVFDFLRVVDVPISPGDYRRWKERLIRLGEPEKAERLDGAVSRSERSDGLKTQDYKTLWKLLVIFEGHEPLFEALRRWVSRGGKLVIVKGNHDPELHWPLVRRALRDELLGGDVAVGSAPSLTPVSGAATAPGSVTASAPVEAVEAGIVFAEEGFVIGNLYIEHGHEYESMTRIEGGPVLEDDPTQINLPLGSFVNRYFINRIELLDPFIDNIKPVQQALFAVARRHPIKIFAWYLRAARYIKKALAKRRFLNGAVALLLLVTLVVPLVTIGLVALFVIWPEAGDRLTRWLSLPRQRWARISGSIVGLLFPVIVPYLIGAVRETLRDVGVLHPPRDHLAEGARRALRRVFPGSGGFRRVYAVMGHSHVQDVQRLVEPSRKATATSGKTAGDSGKMAGDSTAETRDLREEFYVNTGTWIPLWPLERRDLIGRVIYSFARFDRGADGEYRHQALEWDDQALEPRPARILVSGQRRRAR